MPENLFDVSGRVVLVTGGLGQLGRQFVRTFLAQGAKVAILDCRVDEALLKQSYGDDAPAITAFQGDVTNRASLEKALQDLISVFGEAPHVLINNAALDSPPGAPESETGPFENYPEESWDKVLDVNLKGVFQCCQVFGGAMARAGRGSIINIGSIYGSLSPNQSIYEYRKEESGKPFFKPVAYSASKSGLVNLTRYLSVYWAKQNVRVNMATFAGVFNNQDPRFLQNYEPKVPMGRMAKENEYNGAMLFLASDASSYMTGSNLVIDGGYTAW